MAVTQLIQVPGSRSTMAPANPVTDVFAPLSADGQATQQQTEFTRAFQRQAGSPAKGHHRRASVEPGQVPKDQHSRSPADANRQTLFSDGRSASTEDQSRGRSGDDRAVSPSKRSNAGETAETPRDDRSPAVAINNDPQSGPHLPRSQADVARDGTPDDDSADGLAVVESNVQAARVLAEPERPSLRIFAPLHEKTGQADSVPAAETGEDVTADVSVSPTGLLQTFARKGESATSHANAGDPEQAEADNQPLSFQAFREGRLAKRQSLATEPTRGLTVPSQQAEVHSAAAGSTNPVIAGAQFPQTTNLDTSHDEVPTARTDASSVIAAVVPETSATVDPVNAAGNDEDVASERPDVARQGDATPAQPTQAEATTAAQQSVLASGPATHSRSTSDERSPSGRRQSDSHTQREITVSGDRSHNTQTHAVITDAVEIPPVASPSAVSDSSVSIADSWSNKSDHDQPTRVESTASLSDGTSSGMDQAVGTQRSVMTSAAQSTAPETQPLDPRIDLDRLAELVRSAGENKQSLSIRLRPAHLGTLQIEVMVEHGVTTARLEVESTEAHRIVSEGLDRLRDTLSRAGAHVDRVEVTVVKSTSQNEPGGQFDGGHPGGHTSSDTDGFLGQGDSSEQRPARDEGNAVELEEPIEKQHQQPTVYKQGLDRIDIQV